LAEDLSLDNYLQVLTTDKQVVLDGHNLKTAVYEHSGQKEDIDFGIFCRLKSIYCPSPGFGNLDRAMDLKASSSCNKRCGPLQVLDLFMQFLIIWQLATPIPQYAVH
jgi:hypothetical protein